MATVSTVLVSLLKNEPTITALLGTPNLRLTPDIIPQGTQLPAAAYQTISTVTDHDLTAPNDLAQTRIQLTIWATSAASRDSVRRALIAMFRLYNRQWANGSRARWYDNVRIGAIMIDGVIEDHEQDSNVYQLLVDLLIWANEVM